MCVSCVYVHVCVFAGVCVLTGVFIYACVLCMCVYTVYIYIAETYATFCNKGEIWQKFEHVGSTRPLSIFEGFC